MKIGAVFIIKPSSQIHDPPHHYHPLLHLLTLMVVLTGTLPAHQPGTSPVKIFIMAGQSNMLGKGAVAGVTTPGTLDYTVANDPDGRYQSHFSTFRTSRQKQITNIPS